MRVTMHGVLLLLAVVAAGAAWVPKQAFAGQDAEDAFWQALQAGDFQTAADSGLRLSRDFPEYSLLAVAACASTTDYDKISMLSAAATRARLAIKTDRLAELLKKQLAAHPDNPHVLVLAGQIQLISATKPVKELEPAERYFMRALAIDSSNAFVHAFLATCLMQSGNYDGSKEEAEKAIALQPDNPIGYNNLAGLEYVNHKNEEGLEALLQCFEHCPKVSKEVYQVLVDMTCEKQFALHNGMPGSELRFFSDDTRKLVKTRLGKYPDHYLRFVEVLIERKSGKEAGEFMDKYPAPADDLDEYYFVMARNAALQHESENEFKKYCQLLVDRGYGDCHRIFDLASDSIGYESGSTMGAIMGPEYLFTYSIWLLEYCQKHLNPSDTDYTMRIESNLGFCCLNRLHYEEAEKHFQKALELDDSLAQVHLNLGITYLKLSQAGKAKQEFLKAKALSKDNEEASTKADEWLSQANAEKQ